MPTIAPPRTRFIGIGLLVLACASIVLNERTLATARAQAIPAQGADGGRKHRTGPVSAGSSSPLIVRLPQPTRFDLALDELELEWRSNGALPDLVRQPATTAGSTVKETGAGTATISTVAARSTTELLASLRELQMANPGASGFLVLYESEQPRDSRSRVLLGREVLVWMETGVPAATVLGDLTSGARPVASVPDAFVIDAADPIDALTVADRLRGAAGVKTAYPLVQRRHALRPAAPDGAPRIPDPLGQWHLESRASEIAGGSVRAAWPTALGHTVVVAAVDDGLQWSHPDLFPNYRAAASYDFYSGDPDPSPGPFDGHGTAVGGLIAALDNNGLGGAGTAPRAALAGIRLLAGPITDLQIANALAYLPSTIHIASNSWGPVNNSLLGPGLLTAAAIESAVTQGRGGRGRIFTWAAGNGRTAGDDCNFDGYANNRFAIAVGALGDDGQLAYYSESCSALMVVAPSSGAGRGITTTDLVGGSGYSASDFTTTFGGTSAAAPQVAGAAALMLARNPKLTWRDVQHIIRRSSHRLNPSDSSWTGGPFPHSEKFGFGQLDAAAAVSLASTWIPVPPEQGIAPPARTLNYPIADDDPIGRTDSIDITGEGAGFTVEHVEVEFSATHTFRGDLEVTLTSPAGVVSTLAPTHIDFGHDYQAWRFTSVRHWGETAAGTWTLKVADRYPIDVGTWVGWRLRLFGHPTPTASHAVTIASPPIASPNPVAPGGAVALTVAATDTWHHALDYAWTAWCPGLGSNGAFDDASSPTPRWSAPANPTHGPRSCTLRVTVTDGHETRSASLLQAVGGSASAACSYTVTPSSIGLGAGAGAGTVTMMTGPDCVWSASSSASWLTVANGSGRVGPGSFGYAVAPNGGEPRFATIAAAGAQVPVRQTSSVQAGDSDGDGLPDTFETQFGLNPGSPAGVDGASGDPDGDSASNIQEFLEQTHPRGFSTRYFAEGAVNGFFDTQLAVYNPGSTEARLNIRFLGHGTAFTHVATAPAQRRLTINPREIAGFTPGEFAIAIESDHTVVVDRTMNWGAGFYGSHSEAATIEPRDTWFLAEGATHSGFLLFYLLENPGGREAQVRIRFLLPGGRAVVRTYAVAPASRQTIWVNSIPGLEATDVSADITSIGGEPIVVERAMYMSNADGPLGAGGVSAAVAEPSLDWYFAEGATGPYFDTFLLIANPHDSVAAIEARFRRADGLVITREYVVAANSRANLWLDLEPGLADASFAVELHALVPVVVERATWWPGGPEAWIESHGSHGATGPGPRWAVADAESGGPRNQQSFLLISNTSAVDAVVRVRTVAEDGTSAERTYAISAHGRSSLDLTTEFPTMSGRRFSALVESTGTPSAELVVERTSYSDAGGRRWAAGSNLLATRLP